ncbi:hypothetical protein [Gryllotalpicola ginsengisoli]|uniref:hypothetical protein n=1 Tax=Gryllotalpicola ginsengisoli TaxID=444608 RepID=UPI0003B61D7E|nr:hypothetical protein [Gryllotalpicola ginsengisoli]
MKARVAASVILATGIMLGTAGCNLIAPQETTKITESTSFGVEGQVGKVDIRNAYLVAEGESVNLVATLVNSSSKAQTVTVQPDARAADDQTVTIPAGTTAVLGNATRVQWNDLDAAPGSLFPVYFSYGTETGANLKLPVLTSDFQINETVTPTPVQTATPTPSETSTPTPTATETAGG